MLCFNEIIHLLASLLIGLIAWKIWKRPRVAIGSALLGGFFVDIDHLIDYFLAFGWSFDLLWFLKGYHFLQSDKLYILLHGWEYAILSLALFFLIKKKVFRIVLFSFGLSLFFHLTVDSLTNDGMTLKSYSLIYRAKNNFEIKELVTPEHYQRHQEMKKDLEFCL